MAGSDKEMNVRDNKYKYDNQDSVANGEMKIILKMTVTYKTRDTHDT